MKRDYIKEPLHITMNGYNSEKPYKEDLYYLFIIQNMTVNELKDYFKVSSATVQRWLKYYDIKKPKYIVIKRKQKSLQDMYGVDNISKIPSIREKAKQTCLEKYGKEYYTQCEEGRNNIKEYQQSISEEERQKINEKTKHTIKNRYGTDWYTQTDEFKNKLSQKFKDKEYVDKVLKTRKKNCLQTYGVQWYTQTDEFKNKSKKTCIERYGVDNASKSNIIKMKCEETSLKKYGVKYKGQDKIDKAVREIIDDKEKLTQYIEENKVLNCVDLSHKLGISHAVACRRVKDYDLQSMLDYTGSIGEREVREYVNQYYETINNSRQIIPPYEIDIYIPKLKVAIEYNGDFWHRLDKIKTKDNKKCNICESLGIKCLTITENEWKNNRQCVIDKLNSILNI